MTVLCLSGGAFGQNWTNNAKDEFTEKGVSSTTRLLAVLEKNQSTESLHRSIARNQPEALESLDAFTDYLNRRLLSEVSTYNIRSLRPLRRVFTIACYDVTMTRDEEGIKLWITDRETDRERNLFLPFY